MMEHDLGTVILWAAAAASLVFGALMFGAWVIARGELADEREGRDRGRRYTDLRHILDAPYDTWPSHPPRVYRRVDSCTCLDYPIETNDECPEHNQSWRGR